MSAYSPVESSAQYKLEYLMRVDNLKSSLKLLKIPTTANKDVLLDRFWLAYTNSIKALNSGNSMPLKIFANAIFQTGKVDVIETLKLDKIKEISGYQEPLTMFRPSSSGCEQEALRQWEQYSIFRSSTECMSQENDSKEGNKSDNTQQKSKLSGSDCSSPKFIPVNNGEIRFEKSPNFSTIKCLKQFMLKSHKMDDPISFKVEEDDFDSLEKGHVEIRLFIGNVLDFTRFKLKDSTVKVSAPEGLVTVLNGHLIYQEAFMILNNNGENSSKSALVSSYVRKTTPNLIRFSWPSSGSKSGIIVSVELVKISSIEERVDYIFKKTRPEKTSNSKSSVDTINDELESTSEIITLRDPLSLTRIEKPGRSTECLHIQFFDLTTWFTLHFNSEQFVCPVCNRYRTWSSLYYDDFFAELLQKIPPNIEKIQIFPDKKWEIVDSETRTPFINKTFRVSDESIHEQVVALVETAFQDHNSSTETLKAFLIKSIESWGSEIQRSRRKRKRIEATNSNEPSNDAIIILDSD